MNLSARDLRAVVALIEEQNFTRAAERLHMSQSAISALIQSVEDSLGARLFDRTTRTVSLTPEGRIFEQPARRVLRDLEDMVADFRDHAQRRKGRVAIAALPSIAAAWLPMVLSEFHASFPGIEISLHDALSEECLTMLRSRQVDYALAAAGSADKDLQTEPLCEDEFHLVCRRDHPLASRKTIRLHDLADHPFVHMSRNSSVRQHLEATFGSTSMRTILEVDHLATATGLVEAGLGITVVPALTLFHFQRPSLVVKRLDIPGLTRRLLIVSRKGESASSAAQALHDLMVARRPSASTRPARRAIKRLRP